MSAYDISSPYWWTRPWDTKREGGEVRMCNVWGITQTRMNDLDTTEDGATQVDASIAPLVLKLNMVGIRTRFCCSGLSIDHRGWSNTAWATTPMNGYIAFERDMPEVMLFLMSEPLSFDGPTFIRAQPDATDERLAAAWRTMEERLDARVAAVMAERSAVPA